MKKTFTFILVIILIIGGAFFAGYYWYNNAITSSNSTSSSKVVFEINPGESVEIIAQNLLKAELIKDSNPFIIYAKLNSDKVSGFQAGYFEIPQNSTIVEIFEIFQKAKNKEDIKITIVEGLRYDEVADALEKGFKGVPESKFNKQEFLDIVENPDNYKFSSKVNEYLSLYKPAGKNLEGFLYPDTYFFAKESTSFQVLEKMVTTLFEKLDPQDFTKFNSSTYSFYDYLIIASLIEREALAVGEEPMIADIIMKRLEKGINGVKLLQIDASLLYPAKDWKANAYLLKNSESLYNTYKYPGLPPGPICNPGIHAIRAALNPEANEYYYYLHDSSGKIHFGKTYSEHLSNINKYL